MGGWRHAPTILPSEKKTPETHCTRGCVGPEARLDGSGKSRPTGVRTPEPQVRNESLYWLHYPGPRSFEVFLQSTRHEKKKKKKGAISSAKASRVSSTVSKNKVSDGRKENTNTLSYN